MTRTRASFLDMTIGKYVMWVGMDGCIGCYQVISPDNYPTIFMIQLDPEYASIGKVFGTMWMCYAPIVSFNK